MPIVRWHGWAAKCRKCGKLVDLGEGSYAYQDRWQVRETVTNDDEFKPEEGITDICGCERPRGKP